MKKPSLDELLERLRKASERDVEAVGHRVGRKLTFEDLSLEAKASSETRGRSSKNLLWIAAAAVVVVAALSVAVVRNRWFIDAYAAAVEATEGSFSKISGDRTETIQVGGRVEQGQTLRADSGNGAIKVSDGSLVKVRAQSELSPERVDQGAGLRLNRGSLVVNAARLQVKTPDVTVSGTDAVFLITASEKGSRVAAIEGQVVVQQGMEWHSLAAGQELATNPRMPHAPVKEELASWSQVQRSPTQNDSDRFEVSSVKPSSGGRRGASGPLEYPCNGSGPRIDPGRFAVDYIGVFRLIAWAYGKNCSAALRSGLISGVPDWVRTTPYAVEATIPAGSPAYTVQQFLNGDAPHLQKMLQNLLAERFKLELRRDLKEMPVYNLVVAKDGSRLKPSTDQQTQGAFLLSTVKTPGMVRVSANAIPISELMKILLMASDRPIVDKTDLKGLFDIPEFEFPAEPPPITPDPALPADLSPGISRQTTRILEELGFKLESAKATTEILVIEHIEKPSEN